MLYAFLKVIFRIAIRIFFKKISIKNLAGIPKKGALLIVSNHPNTLIDPIVIAAAIGRPVYFIAKATAFDSPLMQKVGKILHAIPIHRQQDAQQGEKVSNLDVFKTCFDFLKQDGTILIFPEGTSFIERRLRKIKTGTARIALGATASTDYQLDIHIATVGLNYSDARRFRSDVFLHIGEPIRVLDFAQQHREEGFAAAEALTETIRSRLEKLIITTKDEQEDQFIQQVEQLYKKDLMQELNLSTQDKWHDFNVTQSLVDAKNYFEEKDPSRVQEIQDKIAVYLNSLARLQLKDQTFAKVKNPKHPLWGSLKALFWTVLGFPLYFYGLLHNFIPYILPSRVAKLISDDETYRASIMLMVGMLSFTIFYLAELWVFQHYLKNGYATLVYFMSLPLSGFFVLAYWNFIVFSENKFNFFALFRKKKHLIQNLISQREEIMRLLQEAKEVYFEAMNQKEKQSDEQGETF